MCIRDRRYPSSGCYTIITVYRDNGCLLYTSPLVKTCAEAFYVDKLFMGTDGYIPGIGFTSGDMLRAEAAKSMADSARNSIILTDSSKFSEHGVGMQCRLKDINMVFTDDQVPLEAKEAMEQNGIIVETVPR